jgi:hypothetical protein
MNDIRPLLKNIINKKGSYTPQEKKTMSVALEMYNQHRAKTDKEFQKMISYKGQDYWLLKDFKGRTYHVPIKEKFFERESFEYNLMVDDFKHADMVIKFLARKSKSEVDPEIQDWHNIFD